MSEKDMVIQDPPQEETTDQEWDEETLKTSGTDQQTQIISNYPSQTKEQKLKIPYIEKMNGNLCINSMSNESEESVKGSYRVALAYYNKALLSLKMLFDENQPITVIETKEQAMSLIIEVEVPVCLNLGLCYLKLEQYHYAIKYCSQVIDKNLSSKLVPGIEKQLEKAFYRRGCSYFKIGDLAKTKEDLLKANEIAEGKNPSVL